MSYIQYLCRKIESGYIFRRISNSAVVAALLITTRGVYCFREISQTLRAGECNATSAVNKILISVPLSIIYRK